MYSGRNYEQIEVRECLLSFGAETFVFHFAIQHLKIKIHRTIIFPLLLYGCETRSLTSREERRLWVFEKMMLTRIFEPYRDEITGEWRKLHNEELNDYTHQILFERSNRVE